MAKITNSVSTKYRRTGLDEDEAPIHDNTQGEQLIQELVKKQTNTQTSLAEQLTLRKEFISSTELVDLAKYPHGECSLTLFSERSKQIEQISQLKGRGLNNADIQMALDLQHGQNYVKEKYKKSEDSALNKRITGIKNVLEENTKKEVDVFKHSSRHERDLLQSVKAQSESTKLLQYAQLCQPSPNTEIGNVYPPNHPMNQLPRLEQELFGHLKKKSRKRKRGNKMEKTTQPIITTDYLNSKKLDTLNPQVSADANKEESVTRCGSQWDRKDMPVQYSCATIPSPCNVKHVYTCTPQTWYTVQNKKAIFLGSSKQLKQIPKKEHNKPTLGKPFVAPTATSLLIPIEEIKAQKLSIEDIIKIPKFSNYQEGAVSKTLFIKNLASTVTEIDLVGIFGHFEDPDVSNSRMVYRLMGGKMKGQAFITFSSAEQASYALNTVNGFQLKGKPMVIQFGKKDS